MASSLQNFLHEREHFVWHVSEWEVYPGTCGYYGPGMAECVEAFTSVVAPHSRIADTHEWYTVIGNIHNDIIESLPNPLTGQAPTE